MTIHRDTQTSKGVSEFVYCGIGGGEAVVEHNEIVLHGPMKWRLERVEGRKEGRKEAKDGWKQGREKEGRNEGRKDALMVSGDWSLDLFSLCVMCAAAVCDCVCVCVCRHEHIEYAFIHTVKHALQAGTSVQSFAQLLKYDDSSDRQTDRHTDRQTDRQTDTHTDRQTHLLPHLQV